MNKSTVYLKLKVWLKKFTWINWQEANKKNKKTKGEASKKLNFYS